MSANTSEYAIYAAAIYIAADADICNKVFESNNIISFQNQSEALNYIKSNQAMTENERIALYGFMKLYTKLKNCEENTDILRNALKLSKSIEANVETVISKSRVDYISTYYENKGESIEKVLIDPEDFIVNMIDEFVLTPIIEEKKQLHALKSGDYEHPLDHDALDKLRSVDGLNSLVKKVNDMYLDKIETITHMGSYFLVTQESNPYLYELMQKVCKTLNINKIPQLYITDGFINAYTICVKNPLVALGQGCLSALTHDELLFILGHELGHIKSEHLLYDQICRYFPYIANVIGNATLGIGKYLAVGIDYALLEWQRKSEYTADRAGLIACQNPEAAYTVFTKLSGYPVKDYRNINSEYILKQAKDFDDIDSNNYDKILKLISTIGGTHPWIVARAKELEEWVSSGEYNRILENAKSDDLYAELIDTSRRAVKFKD